MGTPTAIFYNLFIAESVTTQGQSYTKAMILAFEAFLGGNVQFGSLNEIIHFIDNIVQEAPRRIFDDRQVLDRDITQAECFYQVMYNCGFAGYYPDERDMQIVWDILTNLNQQDINRIFYKNNLFHFMDNIFMSNMMKELLVGLDEPFMDPNKPPKSIEVEIEVFWEYLKEYVYYQYMYIDRMGRVDTMIRKVCIIADTDSSMVSLDGWFRYNLAKYTEVPMTIKRTLYKPFTEVKYDEFGDLDHGVSPFMEVEEEFDYDFLNNDIVSTGYKLAQPWIIDTHEGVRYSIINIMGWVLGKMIVDYLRKYCRNSNSVNDTRDETQVFIYAKSEFLFKRALVVAQKNYCDIQELQEGHEVPLNKQFTIMGMPINKSTLSKSTKEGLQAILYEEIMKPGLIDQVKVLKELCKFERSIIDNIRSGGREYLKPVTVKSVDHYADPMGNFGIKAIKVYNILRDPSQEPLNENARNNINIVKLKITFKDLDRIREIHPEKIDDIESLLSLKQFKDGITSMAVPLNENIPEWILDYVDYTEVINANMKNFPLDRIGISKLNKDAINYSNILQL